MRPAGTEADDAADISGRTGVYVHLAHPSAHVRTPQIFNAAFHERGIDAVAVSADVAPPGLHNLLRGLRGWRNLAGIGVTMPHKEAVTAEIDEVVGLARHIGAVNVIRRADGGRLVGTNTDGTGFLQGLAANGHTVADRRVLLAGTGGAGRAIAWALARAGVASLTLANRTPARAEELAAGIRAVFPAARVTVGTPDPAGHDYVINATSLGMRDTDEMPVNVRNLAPGTLVAEIIMAPLRTPLLAAAEERGCLTHPGAPMLTSQIDLVIDFLRLQPNGAGPADVQD